MVNPTHDPLIGQTIDGRYRVVERIARGGMAGVYRADDLRLDRPVALKVMHPHLAEAEAFVARFRREARSAAQLTHPGIVAIYDHGTYQDAPYLAMELVDGPNLRSVLLDKGVPPLGKALDVIAGVLAAVAVAHRYGIVHRDIKPENVLIAADGEIKVADFGLARAVTESTAASSGVVLGTVAYLSPELVADGQADTRADVYATGVMLFELLTGTQPFAGEAAIQVAFQHVHSSVPAPSSRVSWLPPALDQLVAKLTAKDPAKRPVDGAAALALVRQVRQELDPALAERVAKVAVVDAGGLATGASPTPGDDPPAIPPSPWPETPEVLEPTSRIPLSQRQTGSTKTVSAVPLPPAPPKPPPSFRPILTEAPPVLTGTPAGPGPGSHLNDTRPVPQVKRRRRWPIVLMVLICVLGVGAGGGFAWYSLAGPGAKVTVPEVLDLDQDAALGMLKDSQLTGQIETQPSDTAAAGRVMVADPQPGSRVKKNSTVKLTVSSGVKQITLPAQEDIIGQTVEKVTTALKQAFWNGNLDTLEPIWDSQPIGTVLKMKPAPGETVDHNATLQITTSKGPEPVDLPDLTKGMTLNEAVKLLEPLNLTVTEADQVFSDAVAKGRIVSQSKPPGPGLHRGDSLTVVVSKGPEPIEVPDVARMTPPQATALLKSRGFEVEENVYTPDGVPVLGEVTYTVPKAGSFAYRGDIITLYIT